MSKAVHLIRISFEDGVLFIRKPDMDMFDGLGASPVRNSFDPWYRSGCDLMGHVDLRLRAAKQRQA